MKIETTNYKYRYMARFIVETETPLALGSGEKDIISDALVATDVNGLPYLPGSSIAGVMRHAYSGKADEIFGFQKDNGGHGSLVIFSEGKIIGADGNVIDGILLEKEKKSDFIKRYKKLPVRQHVRINDKGTAVKAGKFDEQVVYAGTRFCFEMEILAEDEKKKDTFEQLIGIAKSESFRLGGGTRSGFGKMKVINVMTKELNLTVADELKAYLDKPSELTCDNLWWGEAENTDNLKEDARYIKYELTLQPEDFFMFGSGFGTEDGNADMTCVRESRVQWTDNKPEFVDECILIPATSIKGALRHRVAFYYNKEEKRWAGSAEAKTADENEAVIALFGNSGNGDKSDEMTMGNVIFNDIVEKKDDVKTKLLNHVAIDRFTGGAIDGALFTEQVDYGKGVEFQTTILLKKTDEITDKYVNCFELALTDIITGMLPLGGGVNRGNGIFSGSITKDGKEQPWTE